MRATPVLCPNVSIEEGWAPELINDIGLSFRRGGEMFRIFFLYDYILIIYYTINIQRKKH